MVPRTYPSTVDATTSNRQMVAYSLPSISGLVRWVDYIPIKISTGPVTAANTYNNDGYIPIDFLSSITGQTAWVTYIPVYVDTAATDSWQISSNGFIPYAVLGTAPSIADDYYKYVSLLLNTNTTNGAQNNTFLDASTNAFSITRNGNTTQGTFSPFSQTGWSNYFDGTGDYLTVPDNAALDFGSGAFTIEAWVYPTASPAADTFIWGKRTASGNFAPILFGLKKNGINFNIAFWGSLNGSTWGINGAFAGGTITISQNTWTHVAVVRSGTTITGYVNGVADLTVTSISGALMTNTSATALGASDTSGSNSFPGYISNLRALKGTAQYTANFTPPTAPLPLILDTSLLTCQSNRFIDNSSNAFAITRNGDVSVQAFSPFNPTAAWTASTNGGSGYFDGNGDNLSVAHNVALNLSSGDFTLEAWVYWNGANINAVVMDKDGVAASAYPQYQIALNGSGFLRFLFGGGPSIFQTLTSSTAMPKNVWVHVAGVKNGTNMSLYQNGVSVASATQTATITDNARALLIGYSSGQPTNTYFDGYISNARVVKGTAVYTSNFTPPTAPLTAITNTSLLLNFTNAGIFDSASGNDLETVGNAQVSTAVAKWDTTSMAFDGTGDSLTAIDRPALRFNTAPFTIEGWVYLNVINASQGIASKRNATPTGWLLQVSSSNKLQLTFDASTLASTGSLAASTWYHFALVREGTGTNQTKLYINGVNDGTGTVANNFNQTDALAVGSDRGSGSYLNGYIDDLRITNGYARYTANFTPPTAAFPTN